MKVSKADKRRLEVFGPFKVTSRSDGSWLIQPATAYVTADGPGVTRYPGLFERMALAQTIARLLLRASRD